MYEDLLYLYKKYPYTTASTVYGISKERVKELVRREKLKYFKMFKEGNISIETYYDSFCPNVNNGKFPNEFYKCNYLYEYTKPLCTHIIKKYDLSSVNSINNNIHLFKPIISLSFGPIQNKDMVVDYIQRNNLLEQYKKERKDKNETQGKNEKTKKVSFVIRRKGNNRILVCKDKKRKTKQSFRLT